MGRRFQFDRIKRIDKLSRSEQEDLLFDLLSAFQIIREPEETALFVQDLLTKAEVKRLAKRLRIAKFLLEGKKYEEIEEELHTSHGTVAKVVGWLAEKGDGFRGVIRKLPKRREERSWVQFSEWDRMKRRYPMYFWPELLLEEIVKNAGKRERERLKKTLDNLELKSQLHRRIEKLLKEQDIV